MKKLIAVFAATAIIFCSVLSAGASFPDGSEGIEALEALYFENAPVLDGIIGEDEWGEASTYASSIEAATTSDRSPYYSCFYDSVSGSPELYFDLWLRWDDDYFYIAAKVKDPDGHSMRHTGTDSWNGDVVQFRLDPKGSNASGDVAMPWSNSSTVCDMVCGYYSVNGTVQCFDNTNSVGLTEDDEPVFDPVNLAVAVSDVSSSTHYSDDTANGYTSYEIAIPWKYVYDNGLVPIYSTISEDEAAPIFFDRSEYDAETNPDGGVGREIGMSLMLLNAAQGSSSYNSLLSWGSGIAYVQKTSASATAAGSNAVTLSYTSVEDTIAGDLDIELTSKRVGSKLYVYMDLTNNPGIWSMKTTLDYNRSALSPVSYTIGEVFAEDELDHCDITDENLMLITYNESLDENNANTGRVITYEFDILDSALPYDFYLSVLQSDVFDCALEPVAFTVTNSADTPAVDHLLGDINLDGSVNLSDIFTMKTALLTGTELSEDQFICGNVYADDSINVADIFMLKKMILGASA